MSLISASFFGPCLIEDVLIGEMADAVDKRVDEDQALFIADDASFSVHRFASVVGGLADGKHHSDYATLTLILFGEQMKQENPVKRLKALAKELEDRLMGFSDRKSKEALLAWQAHSFQTMWSLDFWDMLNAVASQNGAGFLKAMKTRNDLTCFLNSRSHKYAPGVTNEQLSTVRDKEEKLRLLSEVINWRAVNKGGDSVIYANLEKAANDQFDETIIMEAKKRVEKLGDRETNILEQMLCTLSPTTRDMLTDGRLPTLSKFREAWFNAVDFHRRDGRAVDRVQQAWVNATALIGLSTASYAFVFNFKMIEEYKKPKPNREVFMEHWKKRGQWIQVRIKLGLCPEDALSQLEKWDQKVFGEFWSNEKGEYSESGETKSTAWTWRDTKTPDSNSATKRGETTQTSKAREKQD